MGSGLWSERLQLYKFYYLKSSRPYSEKRQENKGSSKRKSRGENMIGVGKIKQYSNVLDKPLSKGKQEVLFESLFFFFFFLLIFLFHTLFGCRENVLENQKQLNSLWRWKFLFVSCFHSISLAGRDKLKIRSWQQFMTLFFYNYLLR